MFEYATMFVPPLHQHISHADYNYRIQFSVKMIIAIFFREYEHTINSSLKDEVSSKAHIQILHIQ